VVSEALVSNCWILCKSRPKGVGNLDFIIIFNAHRISTVQKSESIIFLDAGMIGSQGTFDEVRNSITRFEEYIQLGNFE
jgi:ABC-type bacteriocin/lantibiotic exporter with double-glycine peptidase domain